MSVYKHQQGSYQSYRVARSVDGKLCQEYFPRTRKGYQEAKKRDEELARAQERAQQFFTGPALRWQKKVKKTDHRAQSGKSKTTRMPARAKSASRTVAKARPSAEMKRAPKHTAGTTRSATSRTSTRTRSRKTGT